MVDIPVYVINLPRSPERLEHMHTAFPDEYLVEGLAIDGAPWEKKGQFRSDGRPVWDEKALEKLRLSGIVADDPVFGLGGAEELWPSVPGDVACALSHHLVWSDIQYGSSEWAIVLEDDVQPTEELRGKRFSDVLYLPKDADIVFLFGNTEQHDFFSLDEEYRVLSGYGMLGYAVSKRGAKVACEAMTPYYEPVDRQLWKRSFRRNTMKNNIPLPETEKIEAYRVPTPLIEIAEIGLSTTMTSKGGEKPWTKKCLLQPKV